MNHSRKQRDLWIMLCSELIEAGTEYITVSLASLITMLEDCNALEDALEAAKHRKAASA
jgi:hypothetical protein